MSTVSDDKILRAIARNMARQRGELSYSEIARRCGTYPAVISRIERRLHMPRVSLLARIADAIDCTVDDLLKTQK